MAFDIKKVMKSSTYNQDAVEAIDINTRYTIPELASKFGVSVNLMKQHCTRITANDGTVLGQDILLITTRPNLLQEMK